MATSDETEPGGEVVVLEHAGIVVLDGPSHLVDQVVAGNPLLARSRRVAPAGSAASGALAHLAGVVGMTGAGSPPVFQLDAVGRKLYESGQLAEASAGGGFLRLMGKARTARSRGTARSSHW